MGIWDIYLGKLYCNVSLTRITAIKGDDSPKINHHLWVSVAPWGRYNFESYPVLILFDDVSWCWMMLNYMFNHMFNYMFNYVYYMFNCMFNYVYYMFYHMLMMLDDASPGPPLDPAGSRTSDSHRASDWASLSAQPGSLANSPGPLVRSPQLTIT